MDEDLRAALARIDPVPSTSPVEPIGGPRARALLEDVMTTPVAEISESAATPLPARRRRTLLAAAAAGVLLLAGVGTAMLVSDDDATPAGDGSQATSIALTLPDPLVMQSCLMFDEAALAQMPMAFAGTVTEVSADGVVLDVDRWFKAGPEGEADTVELSTPGGATSAALDGVAFTDGDRFLVTATDGAVNGCGFSGPATPQLEGSFERAFA